MKENSSCLCTLSIQLALCIAVYITLNIAPTYRNSSASNNGRRHQIDTFFITVAGGFRPLQEQTLLIKQMVDVAKMYKAQFVLDITEYGESDPLLHNATLYPELQLIPWYTTGASEEQGERYFLKKIIFPYYGQTLDIIAVDTVLFQDPSSLQGRNQIRWLSRILKESESDWKIVVGFHQLAPCENRIRKLEEETPFNPLLKILIHYGVDAYLGRETCSGRVHGDSVGLSTGTSPVDESLYLITLNQTLVHKREARGGFLLHRVNSLEMATFFVNSTGVAEHQISFQRQGKAVM